MDQQLAENLAQELKISLEQVIRESYELLILQQLMESAIGSSLVFKGGTALRLAYDSPRFSDDLDFSALTPVPSETFGRIAGMIARAVSQVTLVEAHSKRFTEFALFKVSEPYLPYGFSIKLELSTRPEDWERNSDFSTRLLTSPVTPVSALAYVATLDRLWRDKQAALADRRQPRDLYDLWFIAQKLRRPFTPNLADIDAKSVRRELRKYLPRSHWQVIDQWME